jgi:hypothetical protein
LNSQIHHDACREDELTSLKVISAQRYYHCVEDHFETFERVYEERFERAYGFYRPYLQSVIYRYLLSYGNQQPIRLDGFHDS